MVAVRPSPAHTERAGLVARRDGDGRPVRARGETARSGHPLARSRSKRGPALRDDKRPVAPSPARRPPSDQAAPTYPGAQPRPLRSLRDAAQPSKYGSPTLEICISRSRDMHLPLSTSRRAQPSSRGSSGPRAAPGPAGDVDFFGISKAGGRDAKLPVGDAGGDVGQEESDPAEALAGADGPQPYASRLQASASRL